MDFNNSTFEKHVRSLRDTYAPNDKMTLIQVPQFLLGAFNRDIALNKGHYAFPPTGIQFLKQSLSDLPLNIDLIDLNYLLLKRTFDDPNFDMKNWHEVLDEELKDCGSKIIGVTCTCVPTNCYDPDFFLTNVLQYLRSKNQFMLLAGGANASNDREYLLENNLCDFVVTGEGEDKLRFLMSTIMNCDTQSPASTGIFFRTNEETLETDGISSAVLTRENITKTYEDVPIEDYCQVGSLNPFSRMVGVDTPFATVQLNRGCRANCEFCGVNGHMGKGVRQRPLDSLIEEIHYLVQDRNIRHFDILDDDPIGPKPLKDGLNEFLATMAEMHEKYGVTWSASNGVIAASLNEDNLDRIQGSGCIGFRMGVESGNDAMIKRIRRPSGIKALRKTSQLLKNYPDLFVCGNYIIGFFEEETFGEMMDTYRFSGEMANDWAGFVVFQYTDSNGISIESKKKKRSDFVPSHNTLNRQVETSDDIVSGPGIFDLPSDIIPSPDQEKEIWFAFNVVGNYVNNKNLQPGGRPDKFVSWVDAIRVSYPTNPYMPLFAGLGKVLLGDLEGAQERLAIAKKNLSDAYWQRRFDEFELMDLVNLFPTNRDDVYRALEKIQASYPGNALGNLVVPAELQNLDVEAQLEA